MTKALIIIANGSEDVELATPIDILRRAEIEVMVAGLDSLEIIGARGIKFIADDLLGNIKYQEFDAIILPGGAGAKKLAASLDVADLIKKFYSNNKLVAAICAAPAIVLYPTGILSGKFATCFPGMEDHFGDEVQFKAEPVVVDGNIITSRALGTALPFSLAIVEYLVGKEISQKITQAVLAPSNNTNDFDQKTNV